MRWFLGAFLVTAAAWLGAAPAHACKCPAPAAVGDALHAAQAVFEARVTGLREEPAAPGQTSKAWLVQLHTVRAWKGVETENLTVRTPRDAASCGYPFTPDESYLVYASARAGELSVDACSRTQPIVDASADLAVLGMGVVPVDPNRSEADRRGSQAASVIKPASAPGAGGCASCSLGQRRATSAKSWAWLLLPLALVARLRRTQQRSRSRAARPTARAAAEAAAHARVPRAARRTA